VWFNRDGAPVRFSAAFSQITNQFFASVELRFGRLIPIKVADETDAERDIVEIIAVNMSAVDLPAPTVAHFDFAIAG
jgi:hypothetical protein